MLAQGGSCVERYLVVNHVGSKAGFFKLGQQNPRIAILSVQPVMTRKEPPAKWVQTLEQTSCDVVTELMLAA